MELDTTKRQRVDRLSTEPRLRHGKPIRVYETEEDTTRLYPIFKRYPKAGLPADYIHALFGGGKCYIPDRLSWMASEPNLYLHRPKIQERNRFLNNRELVYMRKGQKVSAIFSHDLMTNMWVANVEIGATQEVFDHIPIDRILAKTPPPPETLPTRSKKSPSTLRILYQPPGAKEPTPHNITADYPLFAERKDRGTRFYWGPETDCDSEDFDTSAEHRATVTGHLRKTLALIEQKAVHQAFGLPLEAPVYHPYIFNNRDNALKAKEKLFELTHGAGTPYIFFDYFPSYHFKEKIPPDGSVFRKPKERAWKEDFYMNKINRSY